MNPGSESKKEFCRTIDQLGRVHSRHRVFTDFCEAAAISLRQPFERSQELEKRYEEIKAPYGEMFAENFGKLLGIVIEALEKCPRDFLGECFHELELHNQFKGQFFTPYSLSMMMARMTIPAAMEQAIQRHGYVSLSEPACGSGGMVIAAGEVLKEAGHNPVNRLWVVAQDIDFKCCCMAYIQMSLMAIPGAVIWGDTLRVECRQQWLTAGAFLGNWSARFRMEKLRDLVTEAVEIEKPIPAPVEEAVAEAPEEPAAAVGQLEFNF